MKTTCAAVIPIFTLLLAGSGCIDELGEAPPDDEGDDDAAVTLFDGHMHLLPTDDGEAVVEEARKRLDACTMSTMVAVARVPGR